MTKSRFDKNNPMDEPKPISILFIDINEAIQQQNLEEVNRQISKLKFCPATDILIPVLEVLAIHEDGRLDLRTATFNKPAPTGMNTSLPLPIQPDWCKVRRDDFRAEAGTYRVVE